MATDNNNNLRKIAFYLSLISQIGISMMVPIFLCTYIGIRLSEKTSIDILVLLFIFLGIIVAFRNVYHLTKKAYYKDKKKEDEYQKYLDDMKKEREARISGDENSWNNQKKV